MNDATLKQIAAAKVPVPKGSHVWISNHIWHFSRVGPNPSQRTRRKQRAPT